MFEALGDVANEVVLDTAVIHPLLEDRQKGVGFFALHAGVSGQDGGQREALGDPFDNEL